MSNARIENIRKTFREKHAKLTQESVNEMRRLYSAGEKTQSELARQYNITRTQARNIVLYKQWK